MHLLGVEADAFAPRRRHPTAVRSAWCVVPVALIIDREAGVRLSALPPRIPFHRHSGRADDLVGRQIERDVVARELAVELARGIERVVLPAVPAVHHDLGIPLREVAAAPLASL